jgi:hypothetical protein
VLVAGCSTCDKVACGMRLVRAQQKRQVKARSQGGQTYVLDLAEKVVDVGRQVAVDHRRQSPQLLAHLRLATCNIRNAAEVEQGLETQRDDHAELHYSSAAKLQ